MLRQIAEESAKKKLSYSKMSVYPKAVKMLMEVLGVKSPKDAEEQEERINNLRRQAQTGSVKHTEITVNLGEAKEFAE